MTFVYFNKNTVNRVDFDIGYLDFMEKTTFDKEKKEISKKKEVKSPGIFENRSICYLNKSFKIFVIRLVSVVFSVAIIIKKKYSLLSCFYFQTNYVNFLQKPVSSSSRI